MDLDAILSKAGAPKARAAAPPAAEEPDGDRLDAILAKVAPPRTAAAAAPPDQLEPGNIDLHARPIHRNPDGSISTVRSMSFQDAKDGPEILVPTIADDGSPLSDDAAIDLYRKTGKHLGKFKTPDAATAYAQRLHEEQAREYLPRATPSPLAAPGPEPSTWDRVKAGANDVASTVGALGTRAADAASFGLYSKARNAIASRIAPDATAAQVDYERRFGEEHPFAANSAAALGYMAPIGGPGLLAKGADMALGNAAEAAPALASRFLTSAPVRGAVVGAAANAGTTEGEDLTAGASPAEAARDAGHSAVVGGALGAGFGAASAARQKAAGLAADRAGTKVYRDLGQSASSTGKARLKDLGPEPIAAVDREFGISTSPNPPAAIKAARAQVGAAREAAFQEISAAGGDVSMDTLTRRLDALQADFGDKAGTRPFAGDVARLRGELLQRYGEAGKVSAKALADEISAIDNGAYGGNYANPKTSQIVQRRTAGALREVQNQNLDAVAKLGTQEADAVAAARAANAKFAALKTMEPIVKAKAVKKEFEPGFIDKALDNGFVKTAGHAVKDKATGIADRALSAVAGGGPAPTVGPAQVARLVQLARSGASREQITAQAQTDGTPVELAANIAQQYGR